MVSTALRALFWFLGYWVIAGPGRWLVRSGRAAGPQGKWTARLGVAICTLGWAVYTIPDKLISFAAWASQRGASKEGRPHG